MRPTTFAAAGALLAIPAVLAAQAAPAPQPEPAADTTPAATPDQPAPVDVTLWFRTRLEAWNWFDDSPAGEYAYSGSTLRLGLQQQRPGSGWQAELAAPVLLGLPQDATAPPPAGQLGLGAAYAAANDGEENAAGVFLKQAYLRIGAAPGGAGPMLRAGRFEFVDGLEVVPRTPALAAVKRTRVAHRMIGTFGWSHVGRSFDGAHAAYGRDGWNVTAVAARPTQGVFDVDGWRNLNVGLGYAALSRRGAPASPGEGEARVFLIGYRDARDWSAVTRVDNRPLAVRQADGEDITVATLGGHYLRAIPTGAGPLDVLLWGAVQRGDWGAQDHRAWAGVVEAGWQPAGLPRLRPWLRAGYSRSSGDADPADGVHGTFFQKLPTPRVYARFPFHNQMNLEEAFASLAVRPGPRLTLRTDARALALTEAADLWYAGGGAFQPNTFGFAGRPSGGARPLATVLDLSADYRVTERLTASGYYGWAGAGPVIHATHPGGRSGALGFIDMEYRH